MLQELVCLHPKKIMEKLEMFDSFLFAYHDDLDLCWRAALEEHKIILYSIFNCLSSTRRI